LEDLVVGGGGAFSSSGLLEIPSYDGPQKSRVGAAFLALLGAWGNRDGFGPILKSPNYFPDRFALAGA
jgi:hypothetical protein